MMFGMAWLAIVGAKRNWSSLAFGSARKSKHYGSLLTVLSLVTDHSDKNHLLSGCISELERYPPTQKNWCNHTSSGASSKRAIARFFATWMKLTSERQFRHRILQGCPNSFVVFNCYLFPASARSKWVKRGNPDNSNWCTVQTRFWHYRRRRSKTQLLITIILNCLRRTQVYCRHPSGLVLTVCQVNHRSRSYARAQCETTGKLKLISRLTGLRLDDQVQREAARAFRNY